MAQKEQKTEILRLMQLIKTRDAEIKQFNDISEENGKLKLKLDATYIFSFQ